jgi:NitT/TauT family transport system permease protein
MRIINKRPGWAGSAVLAALPFLLALVAYATGSAMRLAENPRDRILPDFQTLADAVGRVAFNPDPRTGEYLLWIDTLASLERMFGGLSIALLIGFAAGIAIGLVPYARSFGASFVAALSFVPPLAVLPILFIVLGLGETSKIALIAIGITPFLIRDMALRTSELPPQQIIKAQTLGGSTWQIAIRVVVPQILPRLLDSLRLALGPAWLFLISAEAIASESGLGYRIFLVRRYLAMDVILPYVVWITILAFLLDLGLRLLQRRAFPWFAAARSAE